MTTYNKSLKDDSVKFKIIEMSKEGFSGAEIGRDLGIPERSVRHFLSRSSFPEFWEKYSELCEYSEDDAEELVEDLADLNYLDLAMKLKENTVLKIPPQYLSKDATKEDKEVLAAYHQVMSNFDTKTKKILVIADTQCKPGESLNYMRWIGKYIFDKKPDIVVHIGDNYDVPSLSSYDKGKRSFEGRRLKADLEAGTLGLELLIAEFKKDGYNPRMVFCLGNHEERIDRLANDMPELEGFVGTDLLPLAEMGWEVQPFLKPIDIEGIFFVHYLANPFTGKPYAGTALNQLKTVGRSFVVGHKQCLDVAIRPTIDGKHQIGIINGAAYDFDEPYKGWTGNNHFRGITMLHEVKDGFGLPMFVSLDYLKDRYIE